VTEIKHKITNLLNSVHEGKIAYDELELTLKHVINNEVSKDEAFSFLDLLHFSSVSKIISQNNSHFWAIKTAEIIEKYNYHTGQLLLQRFNRYKNKTAIYIIDGNNKIEISFKKLWNDILLTASALQKISKNKSPVVGVLSHNQYKTALVDLASLSFGIRIIPIPLNSTKEHFSYILKESKVDTLFLGGEKSVHLWNSISKDNEMYVVDVNGIGTVKSNFISWDDFLDNSDNDTPIKEMKNLPDIDMNWTNTIMYTSGSTSNPKGVKFSQLNIISKRFSRALALPEIGSSDIFLCYLPLFHTFGRYFELMGSIFWGATYTFAESPAFNSLLKDFPIISPTVFISIPKRWVQIYDSINNSIDLDLSSEEEVNKKLKNITGGNLKWGLSAAGYLDPDIFLFFQQNKIELISGYGMTEATGGITMTPPKAYIANSVGRSLPGIELKIEDDGELCMKGPYVSSGFYKIKDSKSFKDGWFFSGDIFKRENGYYFIVDRKKDIYKNSRGQTIAPQKIENLFQDFDLVQSVFLVGDGKEYNTVLIYPNRSNDEYNLEGMNDNQIHEIFSAMLISINGFLSPFERIVNFSIIGRDFSMSKGELTQKGTYKRKNVIKNFSKAISSMYKKNYLSLYNDDKEIKFPNWLIREIGTIKTNIKWNGNDIKVNDKNVFLTFRWYDNKAVIGNFTYIIENKIFDLDSFINDPKLWLGNVELVDFISNTIFRIKEAINYQHVSIVISENTFSKKENIHTSEDSQYQLELIHLALSLYLNKEFSFNEYLNKILEKQDNDWSDVILDTFIQYLNHPDPYFRLGLLETLAPIFSENLFVDRLRSDFRYFKETNNRVQFEFNVNKITLNQYSRLIKLLKDLHNDIDDIDSIDLDFIQNTLKIICEYGKIHPTQFVSSRAELVWWQLSRSPSQIKSSAQKEYYDLINGFRQWLGPNTSLTIDRETKEEYTWKEVIIFDDNVRENHKNKLIKAISSTALIKESIFLFTDDTILQLSDIPKNGIWIKHLNTKNNKSSFRVLVKTISFGSYNIILNLNHNDDREFFEDEIKWLILMGSKSSGQTQLVEKFGGYWPEESIYTEEYVTNDTVNVYLVLRMTL